MNAHALLARYGSPAYVYDLNSVRQAHAALMDALPGGSVLYYSLKANAHPALVAELRRLGCRAEASSIGELRTALGCECPPASCLYTGPGKTMAEITFALQQGVSHFSVDSPADLRKVGAAAEANGTPAQMLLRINPDEPVAGLGLTMTGGPSQFGADASWVRRDPEAFAGTPWARVIGFHVYMGTNIPSTDMLLRTFEVAVDLAVGLSNTLGIEPELVDVGGGFGHPFAKRGARVDFSGLRAPLESLLDARLPGWRAGRPRVAFEAGRYLVAAAGTLLCTVQDVKESKGHPFVVLDTGIHHLGGMSGLRRLPRTGAECIPLDGAATDVVLHDTHVVGPLCTPLDYLSLGVDLPGLSPGAVLAVPNVGAYGLTASLLAFLSREAPVEIVLDGEEIKEASQLIITRCAK